MSYYPYGSVPGQGYVQPGVQANPIGYAAPVANPFHNLIASHGLSKMISGMSGSSSSSSYSSDPDVSVVTYDSYMEDKEFSKTVLGIRDIHMKKFGKPMGLKFKDCGVVIPLPSKVAVCNAIDGQIENVTNGAVLSDKKRKEVMKKINENLAISFFKVQCKINDDFDPATCEGLPVAFDTDDNPIQGKIRGVDSSIRNAMG